MSQRKVYYVSHNDSGEKDWSVKLQNAERASKNFENKNEAIDYAVDHAKEALLGQVKIKGMDGRIQQERTYGDDPEKYPG